MWRTLHRDRSRRAGDPYRVTGSVAGVGTHSFYVPGTAPELSALIERYVDLGLTDMPECAAWCEAMQRCESEEAEEAARLPDPPRKEPRRWDFGAGFIDGMAP